jgi:UDP-N-acetyl-D-galactosamine dehydrogenase
VGGHCIGVDPYYLVYKAKELGYHPQVIDSGRSVNDSMGCYIADQTVKKIAASDKNIRNSRVLVMGVTFKENVSDIRNSKVVEVVNELRSYKVLVDVIDPFAVNEEVLHEYGFELSPAEKPKYDAVVIAVAHRQYAGLTQEYFDNLLTKDGIVIDVKGIYKNKIKNFTYWSL